MGRKKKIPSLTPSGRREYPVMRRLRIAAKLRRLTQTRTCKKCGALGTIALWPRWPAGNLSRYCCTCQSDIRLIEIFDSQFTKSEKLDPENLYQRVKRKHKIDSRKAKVIKQHHKSKGFEVLQDRLVIQNAKQAFRWWLKNKADAYYDAMGKPWLKPFLTNAEKVRLHYRHDPEFNLRVRIRRQIKKQAMIYGDVAPLMRTSLNTNGNSNKLYSLFGYKIVELKNHLEKQFTKGMSWKKYKEGKIHIDHIIPVKSFDLSNQDEFISCWALSNLRPLYAKDNKRKGAHVEYLC